MKMKKIKSPISLTNFYIKKFLKKNTLIFGQNINASYQLFVLTRVMDKFT